MDKEPRLNPAGQQRSLAVLILAAGMGTRMKSRKAKVLHEIDGRPLIDHVCRTARALDPKRIYVVVGYQASEVEATVRKLLGDNLASFVTQAQQRGTGDAVMAARDALNHSESTLLVLSGDVPLIRAETLSRFVEHHRASGAACSILSVKLENPAGYGRIVRDEQDRFVKIVEQKDASAEEKQLREVNSGFYCFDPAKLFSALERVQPLNRQGEYYLTDVPGILLSKGDKMNSIFTMT